ncbi:hypothetical protein NFHSH190041_36720 (plasmid) [Shewanella sp. NFH-SH190041]|uniref:hypothetical protein n=1 Tax=Shewanella sp. NFH-SH190041 TaxID=2950245 RepID=UPI0021C49A74|nr:hypothetical protein [Shewanella sp. NFH-SH190041]BDM66220.1 hypothetical protein NFHSH190041_36720 [Shewanella sp. NFH-SH190041]
MIDENAQLLAEYEKSNKRPVLLIRMALPDGVLRVNSHVIELPFQNEIYLPVGGAGKIGQVKENGTVQPHKLSLTLSSLDPAMLHTAMNVNYMGCEVKIFMGMLDEHYQLIAAQLRFKGRIVGMPLRYGNTNTIDVQVSSRFEDWSRVRAKRYSSADQEARYPGDKFCDFAPQMVERPIQWGVPYRYQGGGGGGGRERPGGPQRLR